MTNIRKITILLFFVLMYKTPAIAEIAVNGSITDPDNNPVINALVEIMPGNPPDPQLTDSTKTDENGKFSIILQKSESPGLYLLSIKNAEGFQDIKGEEINLNNNFNPPLYITMIPIEKFEVTVSANTPYTPQIAVDQVQLSRTLDRKTLLEIPTTRSPEITEILVNNLPGIIKDSAGNMHFDGGQPFNHNWQLSRFNIGDPVKYTLETRSINPEAIEEIDFNSGRYSVDGGKGYTRINMYPHQGADEFSLNLTNPVPGIDINKGLVLSDWKPKLCFSGPIKKGGFWFSDCVALNYNSRIFEELPKGKDKTTSWAGNNLFSVQGNISPRNIWNFNFMTDYLNAPNAELSPINPHSTTTDLNNKIYFGSIGNRIFTGANTAISWGYGYYQSAFEARPQGEGPFITTPVGNRGFAHKNSFNQGKRHQLFANITTKAPEFLPKILKNNHRHKYGTDFQRINYCQDVTRTSIETLRIDETLSNRREFFGNGNFCKANLESAFYFQDSWNLSPGVFVQAGLRMDTDRIVQKNVLTSRYSLALMPSEIESKWTKFLPGLLKKNKYVFGYGRLPAPYPLNIFTRHLDQYSIVSDFNNDGSLRSDPFLLQFTANSLSQERLTVPTTVNYSFGIERLLPYDFILGSNFLRKKSRDGYVFVPVAEELGETDYSASPFFSRAVYYDMKNLQKISYDAFEFSIRKIGEIKNRRVNWFLNYTYSKNEGNGSGNPFLDDLFLFSDTAGPTSWDVPHRLLTYGYFDITSKYAIAYHLQHRTGTPYTAYNDEGRQVGGFNSQRLPNFLSLNLHFEIKHNFFKRRWALRIGSDNITGHFNPTIVNANTSVPGYPIFYGSQPRKPFVFRVRYLGKVQ